MSRFPSYVAITPARNESDNLRRLGACMLRQTARPDRWIVVDDGSNDDTRVIVDRLAATEPWITVIAAPSRPGSLTQGRAGGRDVLAFNAGLAELDTTPDFLCKLDADVSLESNYFEEMLTRFSHDPGLGIASGICYEKEEGEWTPKHMTAGHVRGAARIWRRECFDEIGPLLPRLGWDGIDELEASVKGWRTVSFSDIPILHHRKHGARDGSARSWAQEGETAHFMGYRLSYLVIRTIHHTRRQPAALAIIWGYLSATLRRQERYPGLIARRHLRRRQRWRELPRRRREVAGELPEAPGSSVTP